MMIIKNQTFATDSSRNSIANYESLLLLTESLTETLSKVEGPRGEPIQSIQVENDLYTITIQPKT